MQLPVAYLIAALLFLALDALWLWTMGASLYRQTLGDLLAPEVRLAPAAVFYLLYPVGIVAFAVAPALKAGAVGPALGYGLLFGAIAYATYDLTNHATLRVWSTQITLIDIGYGAIVTATVAVATYLLTRTLAGALGFSHS